MLRGNAFVHKWRFAPYILAYALATRLIRVRKDRVLFLSDSRLGFSGNFSFLLDELRGQRPSADVIGIFKPSLRARRRLRDTIRLPWLMASAQTIVVDDFYPLVYPLRIRPETRLLQVWHAAGAFKRVGWSRAGLPGGPLPGSLVHLNYTDATVSAEEIRSDYAEAYGIPTTKVHALGVPRTDVFFDHEHVARASQSVRQRYGIPASTRIALFAPTFRGNGQLTATYDVDSVPWESLAADLGDDWVVLVKLHPFVTPLHVQRPDITGVIDVSQERELNELLMAADVLITDYSSAIFEYALLDRPIVFYCPDLDEYTATRDFYYPLDDYITGPLVKTGDELADAIRSARVGEKARRFRERFMSACDGRSSERIVRELLLSPRAVVQRAAVAPGGTPEPTRAEGRMRLRLAVAWLARTSLRIVYAPLKLLPTRRKVVMISREHPTVPDDFHDLADAIAALDSSVRVVILVKMVPPGILGKIGYAAHMLAQLYHVATSRVLIVDTYAIVASVPTHKKSLTVIQIWHALGAFKKFGLSILGRPEGRDARLGAAMRMHEGYDIVLTSSAECRSAYAQAFGTDITAVQVAPLPRVDRLRDPALREQTRQRIVERYPHLQERPIAVFAPTFRLDGSVSVDAATLTAALEAIGVHTVVKLHPLMHGRFGTTVDTAEGFSTQEMLAVADIFVTDYSSTLYEAAVVGVPTYFLTPDLDDYLDSRDFYLDYRRDLPGPIVTSVEELVGAVAAGAATPADAAAFAHRWVQVPGDPVPAPGATPCADAIAATVLSAVTERATPRA
nr:CDP-glycerol glycerophosphotransferase family protein [Microbacterium invictum]